jgi:dUTP pyrophosphatase
MKLKIKKLHNDAVMPSYATDGSAGFDLSALEEVLLYAGQTLIVKTGLSFAIPKGYEIQIRPRSGVTVKTKLRVALGTIDSDYRGEVGIIVDNIGDDLKRIGKGERIAQAIISPIVQATFEQVTELDDTDRGSGGFGSTGL